MYYMMTFDVFQKLVLELIPCLQSQCFNFVRPHLEIKKIIAIFFTNLQMDIVSLIQLIVLMWVHQLSENI
jgi:hypothetical protein